MDNYYFINIFGSIDSVYGRVYTNMRDAAGDTCKNVVCEYSYHFLSELDEILTDDYIRDFMRRGVKSMMESVRRRDPDGIVCLQQMILMKDLSDDPDLNWDITCFNTMKEMRKYE